MSVFLGSPSAFLFVGLLAGIASGLFGVGGGIIIVPLLMWFFGFSQLQATGTSLVALLLPVGALAVFEYYRNQIITGSEIKWGLLVALGLFLGALLGAKLAPHLNALLLKRLFALILAFAAIRLWFFEKS